MAIWEAPVEERIAAAQARIALELQPYGFTDATRTTEQATEAERKAGELEPQRAA